MRKLQAGLLLTYTLCLSTVATAQPESERGVLNVELAIEEFLANLTFTHEKEGALSTYEVTSPEGTRFKLSEAEGLYTITSENGRAMPVSGDWSRRFQPTRVACGESREMAMAIIVHLAGYERIFNSLIGSIDGGRTARYEFSAPFTANQILDPMLEVLERANIYSKTKYEIIGPNVHRVQGQLMQPSDFDIYFKMEVGVVDDNLIMGFWHGTSDNPEVPLPEGERPCFAEGLVDWSRQH